MIRRTPYTPALELCDEDLNVELIAVPDESKDPEGRALRIENLITKIILLGERRGRPKKEESDDIAA